MLILKDFFSFLFYNLIGVSLICLLTDSSDAKANADVFYPSQLSFVLFVVLKTLFTLPSRLYLGN